MSKLHAIPVDLKVIRTTQFFKFSLVGCSGLFVNTSALYVLHELLLLQLIVASVIAVELAIANNFFWNNSWTFRQTSISVSRFLQFNSVSLAGLLINVSVLWTLAGSFGVHYLAANFIGVGAATAWNFGMNVLWTWRNT